MSSIQENLKALRIACGLSQDEAAQALHVVRQTISSYETGRTEPDMDTLKKLAELYHADIHDVLYGGNRTQRRLRVLCWTVLGICAVLLLCLLLHSALLLINNTFFVVPDGTAYSDGIAGIVGIRFAILNAASCISGTGTTVFCIGGLILIYPIIKYRKVYLTRKLPVWLAGFVIAMLAVTVPFMLCDPIYGSADYLLPVLYALSGMVLPALALVVSVVTDICRKQKAHRE